MRRIIMVLAVLAIVGCPSWGEQTPRPFIFGLNIGMNDRECKLAKDAGCTSVRIGCGWDLVEPVEGEFNWRAPDRAVEQCMKWGFEPFFLVVATPKWALSPEKHDKPWGWPAEPEFYPQARRFYKMLAERYKGKVKYFEFWNEQNGYSWNAINKPEEYAPILKLAYQALKEGNPDCVVGIGGLDGAGWKGYYRYLESLYELGCGDYFDAVGVHPYRWDGPIDEYGLKKIHEVLVSHGHGDRKIWMTEYGWDKEYGHHNKAKWLKQSLDILTRPDMDFVFQASVHTLSDFDDAEFGICDKNLNPRPAYKVFHDYPKDWDVIAALQKIPPPPNYALPREDSFQSSHMRWTTFGDAMALWKSGDQGIKAEIGDQLLAAYVTDKPKNGGAWLQFRARKGLPVRIEARAYTNQRGSRADNSRCRVGLDPTGGTDPTASTVVWGRWRDTSGVWDTVGVGQGDPIIAEASRVTAFLEFAQKGDSSLWVSAFDNIRLYSQRETFILPE